MRITKPLLPEDKDPNAEFYLDQQQRYDLASYLEQCDINNLNLKSTKKAFDKCNAKRQKHISWWQKPTGIVGIVVVSLLSGFVIGELRK